jgi:ribulose bisphosphate carboxylase small subunit
MRLYHVSDHVEAILEQGFEDGAGFYRSDKMHRGVWLFDRPVEDGREREADARTVVVEVPDGLAARHEWIEENGEFRRFLIPARTVNRYLAKE